MTTPTPEQLEELSLKCAKICGWHTIQQNPMYPSRKDQIAGFFGKDTSALCGIPDYCGSYDAIMPEIKKLSVPELLKFVAHIRQVVKIKYSYATYCAILQSEPWQLCESFVRTKTEAEQ